MIRFLVLCCCPLLVLCRWKQHNVWLRREGMTINVSEWRMEGLACILNPNHLFVAPLTDTDEVACNGWAQKDARCEVPAMLMEACCNLPVPLPP